jgi:hypothetical protein
MAGGFDRLALYEALDARRIERGLTWRQVTAELNAMSEVLDAKLGGSHPISPSTLSDIPKRGAMSCQHALHFILWLDRTPESFMYNARADIPETPLHNVGPDKRLRWNVLALYEALDSQRQELGLTWRQVAEEVGAAVNQLTGLRTVRYGTSIDVAMRVTQWLGRPAADFTYAADW